jgi:O-antigen/teichoic acid export membrane protein
LKLLRPDTGSGASSDRSTHSLARGTAWMIVGQVGQLVCALAYFVVIARVLRASGFGALAASVALVAIFVPFAAWGAGNILVMEVARNRSAFRLYFGNALMSVALSGLVLVGLVLVIGAAFLGKVPLSALLFLAIADLGFARVADIAAQCFQASDRMRAMALASMLVPASRCVAVFLFAASQFRGLVAWTAFYLVASAVAAALAYWIARRRLGRPAFKPRLLWSRFTLGGYFAVAASASTIYGDVDKTMLGRFSTFGAAGIYAAAYRAVTAAFIPVMALLFAAYPRFFRAGMAGIEGSVALARRLLTPAVLYGVMAGIAIYLLAPLAPHILGPDFAETTEALRWLAPIPLLSSLCYLPADALTGADAQGLRTILQLSAALFNVVLNLLLIPAYSWRGAAWSTIATFVVLAAALWLATALLRRGSPAATTPSLRRTG